jgi:fido (protein-threonine AMPylation protein)
MKDSTEPVRDPFEEYTQAADPTLRERLSAWQTAIGLQAVDGLKTSAYLKEVAGRNIEGEISVSAAQELIESYYKTSRKQEQPRTDEADIVSARISAILQEQGFSFSPAQYLSIHRRLFEGIYKHAGKIRDYNISKSEWVLDGDTVIYGGWQELRATLEYDFNREKAFRYEGLSMDEVIRHLAVFVSRLWQIHVFGEGNTRTTAVFFILYLRSLGFTVTNDVFRENAWYFRNAMVRANYTNLQKGVHETTDYLELFLRNLLLGETNVLSNRTMHIRNALSKQYIEDDKQYIRARKQDIDKLVAAGLSKRSAENAAKLYDEFGLECFFGRSDIIPLLNITITHASSLLKKLADAGITEAVSGMGKGKYRFSPEFFKS